MKHVIFALSCCPSDADWFVDIVCQFGNAPSWLIVANTALLLFNRDLYFTVASNVMLFGMVYALEILTRIPKVPHPAPFDYMYCDAYEYAFPDPIYVTTIAYTVVVMFGFITNKRLYNYMTPLVIIGGVVILFGYLAALLLSQYFDVGLLAANTVIALVIGSLFVAAYSVISRDLPQFLSPKTRKTIGNFTKYLGRGNETFSPDET
jgi:hypothetical protein